MTAEDRNNSIEAMQQGEMCASAAAAVEQPPVQARHAAHTREGHLPSAAQLQHLAAIQARYLERSASAGSKSETRDRGNHTRRWAVPESRQREGSTPGTAAHVDRAASRPLHGFEESALPSLAQNSGVADVRTLRHVRSRGTVDEPQVAEASGQPLTPPPVFLVPGVPVTSPFFSSAAHNSVIMNLPGMLQILGDNTLAQHFGPVPVPYPSVGVGLTPDVSDAVPIEPLLQQFSQQLSRQSQVDNDGMLGAMSAQLSGQQDANPGRAQGGGSNSGEQRPLGKSSDAAERAASAEPSAAPLPQHGGESQVHAQPQLHTAGSLQQPAEGQLVDPSLHDEQLRRRMSAGAPTHVRWQAIPGQEASWEGLQSGQHAVAGDHSLQEANSGLAGPRQASAVLQGAGPGAVPALSVIQGQQDGWGMHEHAGGHHRWRHDHQVLCHYADDYPSHSQVTPHHPIHTLLRIKPT